MLVFPSPSWGNRGTGSLKWLTPSHTTSEWQKQYQTQDCLAEESALRLSQHTYSELEGKYCHCTHFADGETETRWSTHVCT